MSNLRKIAAHSYIMLASGVYGMFFYLGLTHCNASTGMLVVLAALTITGPLVTDWDGYISAYNAWKAGRK